MPPRPQTTQPLYCIGQYTFMISGNIFCFTSLRVTPRPVRVSRNLRRSQPVLSGQLQCDKCAPCQSQKNGIHATPSSVQNWLPDKSSPGQARRARQAVIVSYQQLGLSASPPHPSPASETSPCAWLPRRVQTLSCTPPSS